MVVAGAKALFGRWNTAEDTCPVVRDRSIGCNTCPMAAFSGF
jgi:hypothetical protein